MSLFTQTNLDSLVQLKGSSHSFLKQIASPDGAVLRDYLEQSAAQVCEGARLRWREILNSLDNRRFFQGMAEVGIVRRLLDDGWQLNEVKLPGPCLAVCSPGGIRYNLLVLAFIRQVRPIADAATIQRLIRSLNRVETRSRIAVQIQHWIPHDFDPDPIRQAVQQWLHDVDRLGNNEKYAIYSDDHVSFEFARLGERTHESQSVVALSIPPSRVQKTLERVESRIIYTLDSYRVGPHGNEPAIVACVTEQPWRLSPGWLREMMYGKAIQQTTSGNSEQLEHSYRLSDEPGLFRDPLYRTMSGIVFLDRPMDNTASFTGRIYHNPWANTHLEPNSTKMATMGLIRQEQGLSVMGWLT